MTNDTAALVRQMRDALSLALGDVDWRRGSPTMPVLVRAFNEADQWLAQQHEPMTHGHITKPYSVDEIREKIASHDYSAELLLQHAMLHLDRQGKPSCSNTCKPCRCGPDGCADSTCPGRGDQK